MLVSEPVDGFDSQLLIMSREASEQSPLQEQHTLKVNVAGINNDEELASRVIETEADGALVPLMTIAQDTQGLSDSGKKSLTECLEELSFVPTNIVTRKQAFDVILRNYTYEASKLNSSFAQLLLALSVYRGISNVETLSAPEKALLVTLRASTYPKVTFQFGSDTMEFTESEVMLRTTADVLILTLSIHSEYKNHYQLRKICDVVLRNTESSRLFHRAQSRRYQDRVSQHCTYSSSDLPRQPEGYRYSLTLCTCQTGRSRISSPQTRS